VGNTKVIEITEWHTTFYKENHKNSVLSNVQSVSNTMQKARSVGRPSVQGSFVDNKDKQTVKTRPKSNTNNVRILFRIKKQKGSLVADNKALGLKVDSLEDPSLVSVPFRRITASECSKLCSQTPDEEWFVSDSITLIQYLLGQFKNSTKWVQIGGDQKEHFDGILVDDKVDFFNVLQTMTGGE
jgi:hypothetical protein